METLDNMPDAHVNPFQVMTVVLTAPVALKDIPNAAACFKVLIEAHDFLNWTEPSSLDCKQGAVDLKNNRSALVAHGLLDVLKAVPESTRAFSVARVVFDKNYRHLEKGCILDGGSIDANGHFAFERASNVMENPDVVKAIEGLLLHNFEQTGWMPPIWDKRLDDSSVNGNAAEAFFLKVERIPKRIEGLIGVGTANFDLGDSGKHAATVYEFYFEPNSEDRFKMLNLIDQTNEHIAVCQSNPDVRSLIILTNLKKWGPGYTDDRVQLTADVRDPFDFERTHVALATLTTDPDDLLRDMPGVEIGRDTIEQVCAETGESEALDKPSDE